jgi:hypothetical protein
MDGFWFIIIAIVIGRLKAVTNQNFQLEIMVEIHSSSWPGATPDLKTEILYFIFISKGGSFTLIY